MKQMFRYFLVATTALWSPVVRSQSPTINEFPSREFGHARLSNSPTSHAPNLVEGRELWQPQSVALDTSVSPPAVYVADTSNNRVLAWRSSTSLTKGDFADKVIGQLDMFSTLGRGPGTTLSAGFAAPTAVLVDPRNGSLYVADAGNNRILRFPSPFNQTGVLLSPDLVIGQPTVSSGNLPNQGGAPGPTTLALTLNTALALGMTFDASFNLWVTDAGNNRVLRFPAASLQAGTATPAADLVLGQSDLSSVQQQPQCYVVNQSVSQPNRSILLQPTSLAFDATGRLYVADSCSRVLFFDPSKGQLGPGRFADRVLGVVVTVSTLPKPLYPNEYSLGIIDTNTGQLLAPEPRGVFTLGNNLFVSDTGANRIVRYGVPETWPPEPNPAVRPTTFASAQISPPIASVIGQSDLASGKPNRGRAEPDSTTLQSPTAAVFNGNASSGELWVADAGNNRVIAIPYVLTLNFQPATRVIGQLEFQYRSPNLIEGREVYLSGGGPGAGLAIDKNSNPPHLYIADTQNNRILGFNDARTVLPGSMADVVIGQPDFFRSVVNYPNGLTYFPNGTVTSTPSATGLSNPTDLAVDANGNLWVADSGNGRVLRFTAPFNQPAGVPLQPNVVLGQQSLTSKLQNPSPQNMGTPFGLALFSNGSLAVSDSTFNRILIFKRPAGGDFTSFIQNADIVLGQQDFFSITAGALQNQLASPTHMAVDSSDRLYVCDPGNSQFSNNRVVVFRQQAFSLSNGATAVAVLSGLSQPQGIAVSPLTGEIWIADTNGGRIDRFPLYETLFQSPSANLSQATAIINSVAPLAITLDAFDNLIVGELANRVTFYYAKLTFRNPASYNQQPLAPGMLAIVGQLGKDFNLTPAAAQGFPLPGTLSDLQVSVGGIPAPIFRVDPTIIAFQVPMTAPTSGNPEFQVRRASTGEVVAAALFPMNLSNPAFFTADATGDGPVAASHEDGTVNSASNPVGRGHIISFYLTGQGFVDGAPPDGVPPSGPISTPVLPRINMTGLTSFISDLCAQPPTSQQLQTGCIQYSGLAGYFPGVWQINVLVGTNVPPSSTSGGPASVALSMNDVFSNIGPTPQKLRTTFYVK